MYCPNCNQEYDGKFCPECGAKLIENPVPQGGFNLNLGDANAISGGVHLADSHNVHNEDRSIHNISNTTSTVNNITQVAAQKTEIEILQEKKTLYLNECKRAYEDNVLEQSEVVALEECRIKLGLDKATANTILESVRVMSERNARKTELNPIARTKLKILTDNLQKNEVKALMQQIDTLESLVNKYEHDELRRKFYLVLAALKSEKCIDLYVNTKTDNYWNTFWSYLAYIKSGRISEAEDTLASLDRFTSYPEDNTTVLATAGAIMMGDDVTAKELLNAVIGEYTPALQRFVDSIYLLLEPETAKEMGADENTCAFYLVNFFGQKDPKVKAEEERKRKEAEEAERRKQIEEEKKRKAEEEKKRRAEEKAKREAEEQAKREAEEKKKAAEEARLKAEAERKKREEEERKRKAEEERRRLAEAKAKAEREAREKAEAEKKREAEELRRKAEEESRKKVQKNVIKKLVDDMVLVEGGFFMMGATPDQDSNVKAEKPVHRVKLNPFRMSRYEVTLEQWVAVMDSNPTKHKDPKRPVTSVSWNDCQEFIKRVNEISSMKFRLPTEAEWEFAARGGNKSKGFKYAGSNNLDEIAWIWKNSGDNPLEEYDKDLVKNNHCRTHDVGQKAPNELGLYDMCGNVWEWCADWYGDYSSSDQDNPKGPSSGKERVQRGGCYSTKNPARVAYRLSGVINEKYANLGFRLASEPTANDLKQLQEEEAKRKAAVKTYNGHECVDLGLPSGTLWATCNIGASKPEEYGNYFAWGETSGYNEGKRDFDDEHYKFRVKKYLGLKWIYTKYVENKKNGNVDNKLSLDKEDDAAHVLWGNGWRMPTTAQIEELINKENTTCEIILQNGIRGFQITSKANGNSIFFPAAGEYSYIFRYEGFQTNEWVLTTGANHLVGKTGQYWTRDRLSGPYNSYLDVVSAIRDNREKGYFKLKDHDDCANSLEFYINSDGELEYHVDNHEVRYFGVLYPREIQPRCFGYSIRPVHSKE